ncbi:unnamed protein product [Caenorhabditis angaria]|uniref:Uncharacterized protein n=1 Tax=Caenorhabditis angaria TaxID=860376 RepID=A0A9P1IRK8_9PELO|nr:unnamed protein product [Caenorhabditis angaria]
MGSREVVEQEKCVVVDVQKWPQKHLDARVEHREHTEQHQNVLIRSDLTIRAEVDEEDQDCVGDQGEGETDLTGDLKGVIPTNSYDTPLGTLSKQLKKQKQLSTPYLVLSGSNDQIEFCMDVSEEADFELSETFWMKANLDFGGKNKNRMIGKRILSEMILLMKMMEE